MTNSSSSSLQLGWELLFLRLLKKVSNSNSCYFTQQLLSNLQILFDYSAMSLLKKVSK